MAEQPRNLATLRGHSPCCMVIWEKMVLPEPRSLDWQEEEARTTGGFAQGRPGARKGEAVQWAPARFHRKQGKKEWETPWLLPSSAFSLWWCFPLLYCIKSQRTRGPVRAEPGKDRNGPETTASKLWNETVFNLGLERMARYYANSKEGEVNGGCCSKRETPQKEESYTDSLRNVEFL